MLIGQVISPEYTMDKMTLRYNFNFIACAMFVLGFVDYNLWRGRLGIVCEKRNSMRLYFYQKFGNYMLNYLVFAIKPQIRIFQRLVCYSEESSTWWHIPRVINIKNALKIIMFGSLVTETFYFIHLPTRPHTQHGGLHKVHGTGGAAWFKRVVPGQR